MRLNLLIIFICASFCAYSQIHPVSTLTNQTYVGGTLKLQDAKDYLFGTWTSTSIGIATIGSQSGLVTGVGQGYDLISYSRSGVLDTMTIYVATTDSSGYYFEQVSGILSGDNSYQMQLRDCDGVTTLNAYSGACARLSGTSAFTYIPYYTTYNSVGDFYQIVFNGVYSNIGVNLMIKIPFSKLKDFVGTTPSSNRYTTLAYIMNFGF